MRKIMKAVVGTMLLGLAGCSAIPVTDGFRQDLPKPGTPTVVWGNDVSAVATATTWLQKRGLIILERTALAQELDASTVEMLNTLDLSHTMKDEIAIIRAAKKLAVQEVVFVDKGGDTRSPMISVRGLSVESGHVHWTGTARYDKFVTMPAKHTLANLTCQALATAWEFRAPGSKWFVSSEKMCNAENSSAKASN
jgi:hypothetical protein